MKYIDMHCDTLLKAYQRNAEDIFKLSEDFMVDIERLKAGECLAQYFAIFMQPEFAPKEPDASASEDMDYIKALLQIYRNSMETHSELIAGAGSIAQVERSEGAGLMSGILSIEDGRAVACRMENLEWMYDQGIRMMALTWNQENCFGFPNSLDKEIMNKGLKPFGREAILRMNELGMAVDVSHLSDGGFWDVARLSKKPFVASHSNCRGLSPHRRNLTDEMIRVLADKGGVMGLNFYGTFLNGDAEGKDSRIGRMIDHLKHMINVGGMEVAAIGTDFDGISGSFEIPECSKMQLLFEAMEKSGFTGEQIEKIAYKNVKRAMRDIMG